MSADWLADAVKTQFVWWLTADDALDAATRFRLRAEWQTRSVHATPVLIAYFAGLGFTWLGGNGVALFAALYCTFRALRDGDAQTPAPLSGRVRVGLAGGWWCSLELRPRAVQRPLLLPVPLAVLLARRRCCGARPRPWPL